MLKLCGITDLIKFMMKEAEKLLKGFVHHEHFSIVQDALMLMTRGMRFIYLQLRKNIYFHFSCVKLAFW